MLKKNGFARGKQRYKCYCCGKQFLDGQQLLSGELIWELYTSGKQTYCQLAEKFGCSLKTIQRKIDAVKLEKERTFSSVANVLMDTTYFGRRFGVMVFKNSLTGEILYKQYVKQETNKLYLEGIKEIARRGIKIQAVICDGRKGLFKLFGGTPVQMCQFHQVAIIRRYLTKKPKMQASKDLWELSLLLAKTDKEGFEGALGAWHAKWQAFLDERKTDTLGKRRYVHKKLRSAYRSLKTNLPYLFTWYDNMQLNIPNTTNAIDGMFADLKNKLRNHNGLTEQRKKKFIDGFFKA